MKRAISLVIAVVMCLVFAAPVFADELVPSITAKPAPEIVPILDDQGNEAWGEMVDANGNTVGYLYEECLVITPVSEASTSTEIPDHAEETLLAVYAALSSGEMNLPYEKFNANLDPSTMAIKELFDVSLLCNEEAVLSVEPEHPDHPEMIAPAGVVVRLTFRVEVGKNADVYCMTYKNGEWNPAVSCINNGNGTVTVVFENFCPVAFSIGRSYTTPPASTGDNSNIHMWLVIMAVSTVALGAVLVLSNRKQMQ